MSSIPVKESVLGKGVAVPVGNVGGMTRQEYEGYIGKRECARRLGLTERSIDTYMALKIIPYYKLGRTVRFKWSEVDAFIKEHHRFGARG